DPMREKEFSTRYCSIMGRGGLVPYLIDIGDILQSPFVGGNPIVRRLPGQEPEQERWSLDASCNPRFHRRWYRYGVALLRQPRRAAPGGNGLSLRHASGERRRRPCHWMRSGMACPPRRHGGVAGLPGDRPSGRLHDLLSV